MKYIKSILILFILASFVKITTAQTADEVISKYIAAIGGMDKINSIKTLKITGKLGGGMDIPFVQTVKKPDNLLLEMTLQGMTMKQGYDGTTGWYINPFQGNKNAEKMTPEDTKTINEQAHFEGQLVNYKEKGSSVELMGKEDMEGSDAYKIKLTDKDGDITYYYIDTASYLILKESSKRKEKEKEITSDVTFGDYKSVDGYLFPFSMQIKSNGGQMDNTTLTIENVESNIPVEDEIFKMPESK